MRAVAGLVTLLATIALAAPPPWQRTEARQPCAAFELFRSPFFGDLHIHTGFSADAYIFGTRVVPRDAYAFAKGGTIPFSDDDEAQTRHAHIDRPIDFAAVTDHAEFYGEVRLCTTPGSAVYDQGLCQVLRRAEANPNDQDPVNVQWLVNAGIAHPTRLPICDTPGVDCEAARVSVWQDIQAAAEEAYDRTAACSFTSFVGYEYTASPFGRHLHRNVIFRNEHVPPAAASYIETAEGGVPQGLWSAVETQCLAAGNGCDAVVIPHNSNLSGGQAWLDPADATEALRRQEREPLIEIHQIKGNSECRFDRLARAGAGTADELCTFEQEPNPHQGPGVKPPPIAQYPPRNMVRNILKDGLALDEKLGVNPFRTGFVGDTDNHDGAAGGVAESAWAGYQGSDDASPARQIGDFIRSNPGGLTVAWAEENSRDAIFSALARRETYATSGTRPIVRFFGGDLSGVRCGSPALVRDAYAGGTPMGGELGPVRGARSPRFAVWAVKDAAPDGTDLQRVQIVKGWVDKRGKTHERVFDVAGKVDRRAGVDPATCAPRGKGARELCTLWRDPTFKRRQRAFYYARVLENPTCRWSTRACRAAGVDPLASDCAAKAATAGAAFANCCLGPSNDAFLDPLVQERAWTSPIWYRPEAVGRVRAKLTRGAAGQDRLALHVEMGAAAKDLDPTRLPLTLRVTDDDEIFAATIPPGTLQQQGRAFVLAASLGGLASAELVLRGTRGASLDVETAPLDLSHADRSDHMVTVALESGTYRTSITRLWVVAADTLVPGGR